MADTIYPKGIVLFKPNDKAPDFVKGVVKIDMKALTAFCRENPDYMTDYKGSPQLPLQLLEGRDGLYMTVDTFRPTKQDNSGGGESDSTLPF